MNRLKGILCTALAVLSLAGAVSASESISVDTEAVTIDESVYSSYPLIEWDINAAEIGDILNEFMYIYGDETLTPDGNLTLIDDIYRIDAYESDETGKESILKDKQFITVETKNGNVFYIIIDRSGDRENVYFLNMVDESDLFALVENDDEEKPAVLVCTCSERCITGDIDTNCPVCITTMSKCSGKERVVEKEETTNTSADVTEKKSSNSGLMLILVLALCGGGFAVYWFKFRDRKPDVRGNNDIRDYDEEEDETDDEESDEK